MSGGLPRRRTGTQIADLPVKDIGGLRIDQFQQIAGGVQRDKPEIHLAGQQSRPEVQFAPSHTGNDPAGRNDVVFSFEKAKLRPLESGA